MFSQSVLQMWTAIGLIKHCQIVGARELSNRCVYIWPKVLISFSPMTNVISQRIANQLFAL